jgi:hypothetical protein
MRPGLRSSLATLLLCIALPRCETKVSEISAVCRAGAQVTAPVEWRYSSNADPSVLRQILRAVEITLHYTGTAPHAVPPTTTYFYRDGGAVLRVASTSTATLPANGSFTYHVDTGGDEALEAAGRGRRDELGFFVVVGGNAFGGLLSPPTCGPWADGHLDLGKASKLPDQKDKVPLDRGQAAWLEVVPLPPAVRRIEGAETSTYAFFKAPLALAEAKDATAVPEGPPKQEAQVGVTDTTTLFTLTGTPSADGTTPPKPPQGGKT